MSYEQCETGVDVRATSFLLIVKGILFGDSESSNSATVAGGHCSQNSGTGVVSTNFNRATRQWG